jgi:hypothetical protein
MMVSMQKVIVLIIILAAALAVGRRLYRTFRSKGAEGCGCSNCSQCDVQSTCTLEEKTNDDEI